MSRKLYAGLLPLLATVAFAAVPAIAQAAPHWYSEGAVIPAGTSVAVTTSGTLTLHALGAEITCKVKDEGTVENPLPAGAGTNSITAFENSKCKTKPKEACPEPTIIALRNGAPLSAANEWPSVLLAGPPIRDSISEIEIVLYCTAAALEKNEPTDLFFGSLHPLISETESVATFDGMEAGELEDPVGNKAYVTGEDKLKGPKKDVKITAKNP